MVRAGPKVHPSGVRGNRSAASQPALKNRGRGSRGTHAPPAIPFQRPRPCRSSNPNDTVPTPKAMPFQHPGHTAPAPPAVPFQHLRQCRSNTPGRTVPAPPWQYRSNIPGDTVPARPAVPFQHPQRYLPAPNDTVPVLRSCFPRTTADTELKSPERHRMSSSFFLIFGREITKLGAFGGALVGIGLQKSKTHLGAKWQIQQLRMQRHYLYTSSTSPC